MVKATNTNLMHVDITKHFWSKDNQIFFSGKTDIHILQNLLFKRSFRTINIGVRPPHQCVRLRQHVTAHFALKLREMRRLNTFDLMTVKWQFEIRALFGIYTYKFDLHKLFSSLTERPNVKSVYILDLSTQQVTSKPIMTSYVEATLLPRSFNRNVSKELSCFMQRTLVMRVCKGV